MVVGDGGGPLSTDITPHRDTCFWRTAARLPSARHTFSPLVPFFSLSLFLQYGGNVNQQVIMDIMTGMLDKSRTVNGVPTSLKDLGVRARPPPLPKPPACTLPHTAAHHCPASTLT